jgi:YD repeat-containing protein
MMSSYLTQQCTYDACDKLTHSRIDNHSTDYSYDSLEQLSSEIGEKTQHHYQHDSHYNRIMCDGVPNEINDLDELMSVGPVECAYDLNGNLITKRTPNQNWHFTYDPLNRLTQASCETVRIEMTYDPCGRRLSKICHTAGYLGWWETCREHYLYDGDNEIGAFTAHGWPKQLRTLGLAKHPNVPTTVAIELEGKLYVPLLDCQGNICRLLNPTWGSIT